MSEVPPLRIAIVGGGIGGILSALGILRAIDAGANVELAIYESGMSFSELGAGLSFGCNSTRALRLLGCEEEFHKAAGPDNGHGKLWYSLQVGESGHPSTNKVFGNVGGTERIEAVHRADFLDLLVARLPSGISHFDHRCHLYTQNESGVTMHFKRRDGTILPSQECDILIGADGIKSTIRRIMLGRQGKDPMSGEAIYQNWTVWRGMIPAADFEKAAPGVLTKTTFFGKGKHIVVFPVRGGELVNLVGYVTDWDQKRLGDHKGPWTEFLPIEKALEDFEDWSPTCQAILKAIPKPSLWGVFSAPPIETCVDESVVIIGDAAHASVPHRGAGAGIAVEDALFISTILTDPYLTQSSPQVRLERVKHALTVYKDFRHERGLENVVGSRKAGRILDFEGEDGEGTQDMDKITKALQANLDVVWTYDTAGELEKAVQALRAGN